MIPRYSLPEMAEVWSDDDAFASVAGDRAARHRGPSRSSGSSRPTTPRPAATGAPVVDEAFVAAVGERERITDHDVAAFVDVVQAAIGPPAGSWIHYGLTSSDVVDTALCWAMRDAGAPARRRHRHARRHGRRHSPAGTATR